MPAFTITAALTVAHLISSFASLEPLSLKHVSPKRGGATISNLAGMSVGFGDLGRGGGGEGGGESTVSWNSLHEERERRPFH